MFSNNIVKILWGESEKTFASLKKNWILVAIFFIASVLRLIALEKYPRGTYTDEAYSAYIAYGILTAGTDDRGFHFPVYFIAWGSGMNALYSYLGVIFFKLLGVSLFAYRLPQAVFGILGIAALYVMCKELFGRKAALFYAFVLAVNPWHIMMCRFGLESNLAPNMFLIGLMFLVLGLRRKNKYLVPSAVFLGLTLYCYALTWLMIPMFLVAAVFLCWKWIPHNKITVVFIMILFVLALPLFVFLAINQGWIPEIRTSLFSIPKLTGFRGGELSIENIKGGLKRLFQIVFLEQGDGKVLLSAPMGAYYYFTTPFMVYGVISHIVCLVKYREKGKMNLSVLFLLWMASAAIVSIVNEDLTMIHINMVHIPVIFYGAYGISQLARLLKNKFFLYASIMGYAILALFFVNWYLHQEMSFYFFDERPYEAVARAKEIAGEDGQVTVFGYSIYKFPNLMWIEKWDIEDYLENAILDEDPFFVELLEYGDYRFVSDKDMDTVTEDGVYVIYANRMGDFYAAGFQVEQVNDNYAVAAKCILSE